MPLQRISLLFTILLVGLTLQAQQWNLSSSLKKESVDDRYLPQKYKSYSMEFSSLKKEFHQSKSEKTKITLPTPEGIMESFMVESADVFHPNLIAKYPNIKSYKGYSLDIPGTYIRMGYAGERMHAMILRDGAQTTYIDHIKGTKQDYAVYYKNDYGKKDRHQFECLVVDSTRELHEETLATVRHGDCTLRKYRLALACTAEYANFHGGTVELVLAEYNVAMTRVNAVYEKDAGITMELVPNTDELIFFDSQSDPYTNNDGEDMLDENQTACNDIIGFNNYDIGHVFSTGGGGIAQLRSPCTGSKARGVTGLASPINDPFYIDYVAHEMGHQFGGNHTQNNDCQRNGASAMEPGSASTIMGYAGICAPNVQSNSDDYFHGYNLGEIAAFVTGTGNSCAEIIPTSNTAPSVSVVEAEVTIPASTTFFLTAEATDIDGDMLTFCWEQMDNEEATMPPQGTNSIGPLFRSVSPSIDSRRFFPSRTDEFGSWEVLPTVTRELNFTCTVRDNNNIVGCTSEVDMEVQVFNTGSPFRVTSPNTAVTWRASETETVNWNVSGTSEAPINAATVDIYLSADGGQTFDIVLGENVMNDGTHEIIVPDIPTDQARVVVVGNGVFYDMSDENFSITAEFTVDISPFDQIICGQDELVYTASLSSIVSFEDAISLNVTGLPMGATATLSESIVTTPAMVDITIAGLSGASPGSYLATLESTSQNFTINEIFSITIENNDLQKSNPISPSDGISDVNGEAVEFIWDAQNGVSNYELTLSITPEFTQQVMTSTSSSSSITMTNLEEGTVYYWKVRAISTCDEGEYSTTQAFRTLNNGCIQYTSDFPVEIPSEVGSVESVINVPEEFAFGNAKVLLDITHSWTGDLSASIESPNGIDFDLFDRPGFPASDDGCSRDNILASFTNSAALTAIDFEATCGSNPLAIAGEFQALDIFTDVPVTGDWTLTIIDAFQQDGGQINSWSIETCSQIEYTDIVTVGSKNITVPNRGSAVFDNNALNVNATDPLILYVTQLPKEGFLMKGTLALVEGALISGEELTNGSVTYMHGDNEAMADQFFVDVQIPNSGDWLRNENISITILENTFQVVANVTKPVSCFGGTDGTIVATAVEGLEPYMYSIDNIDFQEAATFDELTSGEYIVYVKDANGLERESDPITIVEPVQITLNTNIEGYSINASAEGGAGGYEYSIDGVNFDIEGIFPDLDNGDYVITVKDANNCTLSKTVNLNIETLSAQIIIEDLDCSNVQDGSITAVASGGIEPYEYSLNVSAFGSMNNFTNLPKGTYTISVKDGGGKIIEFNNVAVSAATPITYGYTLDMGDVVIDAMGGTAPYSYSTNGVDFQSENILDLDLTQDYTLTIVDSLECEFSFDLSISTITSIVITTLDACFSDDNGNIIVTGVMGGVGPFQYSINGGAFQSESVFGSLTPAMYTLTVRDANGSDFTENVTIGSYPEIGLMHFTSSDTLYVNGIGGIGSDYSYSLDGESFNTDGYFTNFPDGENTVYVMDATGCEEDFLIVITDVDDILTDTEIKVYPNPVSNTLQIELLDLTNTLEEISLISIDGKRVLQSKPQSIGYNHAIDMRSLTDGLYILYLTTKKGSLYQRISVIK